ncbi:hypothetical protein Ahy_A02g008716 [Arachis hypogaea]|uniref:Protein FAR1-RELATED SEQUENCE n=1 Tax=Arachis hypogaea TaxID=3818 RepID=A0A445EF82_ARAHY|nr:hypothetical protein Ahy_A02g008716 [Arachis hypogaea]
MECVRTRQRQRIREVPIKNEREEPKFFFELNLEGDHSIKHAFWADASSRAACEYFGDVVSFDTTYNTNRYNLVFGSFMGVNHHGHSTHLGCALMKNENIQSFKWLFKCWLRCMGAKAPKGILTDQCTSMQRAIEILGGNKWLSELYEDRHIWIPVYLDHHFWAGMRSTQRSESMHIFFNKFITRNSSLRQFVKQYDNCLASREQREREFDDADFHTVIPCTTKSAIEAQLQHVYTHEKFKKVQAQFREKGELHHNINTFHPRGILCRHSLSVLSFEQVDNVAPKYILERRSKNIKRRYTHIEHSQDEPLLEPKSKRFDNLVFWLHNICEFASESEELTEILHWAFDNVMVEITRGRPKNRLGSNLEKKISNAKKKKKPALSELNLLDSGPTIQPSSSFYNAPDMNYLGEDYTSSY